MKDMPTVITGTVGVDAHVIGTKIISRALRDSGFNVVELGAQTPPEEFIKVAQETAADAMLMSSLYGMAEQDLQGFKEKCLEAGLDDVLLYLGGILGVTRHDFKDDEVKFKKLGFDRVYPPETDIRAAIEDLRGDLRSKESVETSTVDATYLFAKNFSIVKYEDLPAEVVEATKKQILDFFGVALGGSSEVGVNEIMELAVEWGGAPQSSVMTWGHRLPSPHAAQVNATMAHSLDYDDVHEVAVMHPGVVTLPTALAIAELKGGLSGKEFITAIALGSDLICRLGLATRPGQNIHAFGWHLTTLYGYITAAAVASKVLGMDEEGMINAIGIGYHQSAGNGQCVKDGALTKRMGPGLAVKGGITAALMAQKGITGAKNCLEGKAGLYNVYHGGSYSRSILIGELGTRFEGVNVSIKPYPCCRGVHPSIDAALTLVKEHSIAAEEVESILISCGEGTYGLLGAPLEVKAKPRNFVDSQFSLPWGVATAVARKRAAIEDFTEVAIHSQDIMDVASKIMVEIDPNLSRANEMEPTRVRITMKDGKVYAEQVDLPTGTPKRPLSFADVERKFLDCIEHAERRIPAANAEKLVKLVAQLEEVGDVRELIELVTWD